MLLYDENKIAELYVKNLEQAKQKLSKLEVYCGKSPTFGGLTGWVFEQTIQYCICKEFRAKGIEPKIEEQISLGGRVKADLIVEKIAIEIKAKGLFGSDDAERYGRYGKAARAYGYEYIFVTLSESYRPYQEAIIKSLGKGNTFFMSEAGDWNRFIRRLLNAKS